MKKKITSLKVDSFRGDSSILYPMKGNFDNEYLKKNFSDGEIKQLDKVFKQFFKLVSDNCFDEQTRQLLQRFKKELKSKYFLDMFMEIKFSPYTRATNVDDASIKTNLLNDKVLREKIILLAMQKFFFFSDVVIAFALGNNEMLKNTISKLKKRYEDMSGRPLLPETKKMYEEILAKKQELVIKHGQNDQRASLSNATRIYGGENSKRWNEKKIKSITETIRQLDNEGKLNSPK